MQAPSYLSHRFDAIPSLHIVSTQRRGGDSQPPFEGFNLAHHVGDDPKSVNANRARLVHHFKWHRDPVWLAQVHGTNLVEISEDTHSYAQQVPTADGIVCHIAEQPCAIMTADCLPLVLARRDGSAFACLHVGWRGLVANLVEKGVSALNMRPDSGPLLAWIGPHIGPSAFEVGDDVKQAVATPSAAFIEGRIQGKWQFDLAKAVAERCQKVGVIEVENADQCTYAQPDDYFSYRRDGQTGRQATIAWLSRD